MRNVAAAFFRSRNRADDEQLAAARAWVEGEANGEAISCLRCSAFHPIN
jgi:hypothetical protein